MKFFSIVILFTLFNSCATKKNQYSVDKDGETKPDVPEWIYTVGANCDDDDEVCASAEGETVSLADAHARTSLASIFETKIKSSLEIEKFGYTHAEAEALTERVSNSVNETIDIVLNGVDIKERYEKDGIYFSLAALNKVKASKILKQEIKSIDDQLKFLFEKGKKSSILKMHVLFDQRQLLNEKIIIISDIPVATNMTYSKIDSLKYMRSSGSRVSVKSVNEVPRTLHKWIEALATEVGYKVTKESDSDYLLKVKYFVKEEFLNVKGFKKFSYTINLEGKNNAGEKLGSYSVTNVSSGRNKQDAYLKIKETIQNEIKSNFEKLNLK